MAALQTTALRAHQASERRSPGLRTTTPSVTMYMIIAIRVNMRTVQMTLDEELVAEVDRAAKRLGTTRSAFARDALRGALKTLNVRELERKHREGYARKPVVEGEFDPWESEHAWGEP